MCFKRKNHHDIIIQLLGELKDFQSPTLRRGKSSLPCNGVSGND
jgi:hypothetical protein